MKCFLVYWYHLKTHTNPHTQGYVGVTCQSVVRHRCHRNGLNGGSKVLRKAFEKYGEGNIIKDVLHSLDNSTEAYELEQAYRPRPRIGWNLAIGGGLPPDTTGRVDPPEVRRKRAESVRRTKLANPKPSHFKGMTNRHSEERRQAIGEFHRGKTISEAHKKAITEKMSGENSPKAKEVSLVHTGEPSKVHTFPCIKVASDTLGIPYQGLRSLAQRTLKNDQTSAPSRAGWVVLAPQDIQNPIHAIEITIAARQARFKRAIALREANRNLKVLG